MRRIPSLVVVLLCLSSTSSAADWLSFRGDGRSFAPESRTPVTFNTETGENVAWRSPTTGRGIGGPLVIGDSVIVTGCAGEDERDLYVESFSLADGSRQWTRMMRATGRPFTHPTSSNASPTPASDGKRIFALFSSCDLVCYDLEGHLLWYRALAIDHPKTGNDISMSSSPVVVDGVVIVQLENQGDSFAAGISADSGEILWTNERNASSNWSSPQPVRLEDGRAAVSMHNWGSIELVEAKTGEVLKRFDLPGDGTASATFASPYIIVPGENTTALLLNPPDANDPEGVAKVAWESNKLRPRSCSPVVSNDRVYMGKGSVLMCGSLSDGSVLWQARLGKLSGVWATPVMTASGIYIVDTEGKVVVVSDEGDKGKVIGESQAGEKILASPAVTGNAIVFRSERGLIKIASE
ncbi:MAG: PQQ-binding-like beta-propeller repeat protein [Planctomycetota bacterium]